MLRLIWFTWNKVLRARRFLQDFPSFTDVFVAGSAINDLPYFLQIGTKEYRLTAAVIHMGHTIHHGHYVADVRINNQWMRCNDDKVICSCGWENDTLFWHPFCIYMWFWKWNMFTCTYQSLCDILHTLYIKNKLFINLLSYFSSPHFLPISDVCFLLLSLLSVFHLIFTVL